MVLMALFDSRPSWFNGDSFPIGTGHHRVLCQAQEDHCGAGILAICALWRLIRHREMSRVKLSTAGARGGVGEKTIFNWASTGELLMVSRGDAIR